MFAGIPLRPDDESMSEHVGLAAAPQAIVPGDAKTLTPESPHGTASPAKKPPAP